MEKKPKLALIATYPKMEKTFLELAKHMDFQPFSYYASFEEAADLARKLSSDVDAILSKGGTGMYVKRAVRIPVIVVPITPFDLLRALQELPAGTETAAFIHAEPIGDIAPVEQMTGIRIREYYFKEQEEIFQAVRDAKDRGIHAVIGGKVGAAYAETQGMTGIEAGSGEDTMQRSIHEAVRLIRSQEQERLRSAQIAAAFDSISEGIVVTNARREVTIVNANARNFMQKNNIHVADYADSHFESVYVGQTQEKNSVWNRNGNVLAVTHRRIESDGKFDGVISTFENVRKIQKLEKHIRNELHGKGFLAKYTFPDILTESAEMEHLKEKAMLFARSSSSILIEGESGTGKELFAQSIHNASDRADGPFVAVNCAAIPENLLESELFGYESGAFTGAKKEGKAGIFEMAHQGTIFLDEISELPLSLQSRLLRVIQEREVMRIGGSRIIPVNIRILSATNRDLKKMVQEKAFREDLYYRLTVFNIVIPPLRQRGSDARLIFRHFCQDLVSSEGITADETLLDQISGDIAGYSWPGNVRELRNVAERAVIMIRVIQDGHLKPDDPESILDFLGLQDNPLEPEDSSRLHYSLDDGLKGAMKDIEKQIIDHLMDLYGQDQDAVAEKLKIGRTTLWRKTKEEE